MRHFPESQILLRERGDHLVFQFQTHPYYLEAELQASCNFAFSGKSHKKNTKNKTKHSTNQNAGTFAGFMDHRWGHTCFRDVCEFLNA